MSTDRQLPAEAVSGLLDAIVRRLTLPSGLDSTGRLLALTAASADVRLAIAAIKGQHLELDAILRFALLLIDRTEPETAPAAPLPAPPAASAS